MSGCWTRLLLLPNVLYQYLCSFWICWRWRSWIDPLQEVLAKLLIYAAYWRYLLLGEIVHLLKTLNPPNLLEVFFHIRLASQLLRHGHFKRLVFFLWLKNLRNTWHCGVTLLGSWSCLLSQLWGCATFANWPKLKGFEEKWGSLFARYLIKMIINLLCFTFIIGMHQILWHSSLIFNFPLRLRLMSSLWMKGACRFPFYLMILRHHLFLRFAQIFSLLFEEWVRVLIVSLLDVGWLFSFICLLTL